MALAVTGMDRRFTFRKNNININLADPNPDFSPEEVMNFYSMTYPELTTATVGAAEIEEDSVVYSFTTTVGTKG